MVSGLAVQFQFNILLYVDNFTHSVYLYLACKREHKFIHFGLYLNFANSEVLPVLARLDTRLLDDLDLRSVLDFSTGSWNGL